MNKPYHYTDDRDYALGPEGARVMPFLVRDLKTQLETRGYATAGDLLCPAGVGAVCSSVILNLLDLLVENAYLRCTSPEGTWGQHRVYTPGPKIKNGAWRLAAPVRLLTGGRDQ